MMVEPIATRFGLHWFPYKNGFSFNRWLEYTRKRLDKELLVISTVTSSCKDISENVNTR